MLSLHRKVVTKSKSDVFHGEQVPGYILFIREMTEMLIYTLNT